MYYSDCIVTDRLILRRFVDEDVNDIHALMSDRYIAEKAGFKPFDSKAKTKEFLNNWKMYAYAVTLREDDTVIGVIQTPMLYMEDRVEIGYWLSEEYRGKGYMTEAIDAVKSYMFDNYYWCNEVRILVFEGNDASCNVARKCGFFPMNEKYKENVYSPYGKVESELTFSCTREDYNWDRSASPFYSTTTVTSPTPIPISSQHSHPRAVSLL